MRRVPKEGPEQYELDGPKGETKESTGTGYRLSQWLGVKGIAHNRQMPGTRRWQLAVMNNK
eukprot:7104519-Prorocentrum_lima.AAC.1